MLSLLLSTILVFNEVMASNAGAVAEGEPVFSPAYNFDSWVELYNPGSQAVNLADMYLSNDEKNLKLWKMPSNMGSVPAKGYKVIWLGSNDIKTTQAPFKLDSDGATIYLSDKNGELIVSQTYPAGMSRTSWARKSVDSDEWGWTADATPGESNATAVFAKERLAAPIVDKGSTLFKNTLKVKVTIPEGCRLMYTTDGSLPEAPQEGEVVVPWQQQVKNGDCEGTDVSSLQYKNGESSSIVKTITDGVGVDNTRGIKVHAVSNASKNTQTQFYVYTPSYTWKTDIRYRFHMKVRADKAATITVLAQKKPGEDIVTQSWFGGSSSTVSMLKGSYNVTTEWTDISYEGVISNNQAGEQWNWGGSTYTLKCIAFNLNENKKLENNFYFDEISWESLPESYGEEPTKESKDGIFDISSTTNLTFRLYKDGYLPSVPVTRSYIQTSNNYTLPVISIVGNKEYFTNPDYGFDCDGNGKNGAVEGYTNGQKKNYAQNWDRPVNFSFISTDGEMLFNQDVNISCSGGYTRTLTQRSFKLKSSKVFDGQNHLDYPFFPQKAYNRNKVLLIRNGGNDNWRNQARFLDPALETIIQRSGIDVDVQSYVPIIEYVNGQLRGVLNMREPNNDKFAYANWGYDDDELDAFENLEMKCGDDVAIKRIFELAKKSTDAEAYEELKTLLDIDEYTNYMAVTFFLYNSDWPDNNVKAYRSRNDGRYRFVSFDLDYAFKGCWPDDSNDNPFTNFARFKDENGPHHNGAATIPNKEFVNLFLDLLKNDDYRKKFIDTFCLVGGSVFEPTRANKIVDELLNKVKPMCDLMKQQGLNDGHNPSNAANMIKNNLKGRSATMTNYLKQYSPMKLTSVTRQTVKLKSDNTDARLFVNGLAIPYTDFDGHLFAPVTLKAEAPAGYRFAGWKNGSAIVSTDAEMSLPSDATVNLTATFTKLSDAELTAQFITPVRINEVSADDGIYVNDYFKRNDWVELYNTTDKDIDAEGMFLTDNPEKPEKYVISKGNSQASTIIPAHGYLIIWCDKKDPITQIHAGFKLENEGDELMLTAADKSWTDRFVYAAHTSDQTVGRYPDGSNDVYVMNIPTIEKANVVSSYVKSVEQPQVITGIREVMAQEGSGRIYNLKGQAVDGTLVPGVYIQNGRKFVVK